MRAWRPPGGQAPFVARSRSLTLVLLAAFLLLNCACFYLAFPRRLGRPQGRVQLAASALNPIQQQAIEAAAADIVSNSGPTGGADAELLCRDRAADCRARAGSVCSSPASEDALWLCKETCGGCSTLAALIQEETGLQVRVVRRRGPCTNLHPACPTWQRQGRCEQEPSAMLELCQEACGFCSPLDAQPNSITTTTTTTTGSSSSSSSGAPGASSQEAPIPPMCGDDISVCPYLTRAGMCGSGSTWVTQQCRQSCGSCTPGAGVALPRAMQTSQVVRPPSSPPLPASPPPLPPPRTAAAAAAAGAGMGEASSQLACSILGTDKVQPQGFVPAQPLAKLDLLRVPVPSCHDKQPVRCKDWARAGECRANPDSMLALCPQSCGGCHVWHLPRPPRYRQLNSGYMMPAVGYGTAGLGDQTANAVTEALIAGYRMFDTAESPDWYREEEVGQALAELGYSRGQARGEVFLASKLHPRDHGAASATAALARSLGHLQTSYLDLFMLHYPRCSPNLANCNVTDPHAWQDSWRALEAAHKAGKVRSLGVSNFGVADLQQLLRIATVTPAVVESHCDPLAANNHVINFCLQHNITFIGYSTLGLQWRAAHPGRNPVLTHPTLQRIAASVQKSAAQVALRWALQRGQVIIPRGTGMAHLQENLDVHGMQLSEDDMRAVDALDGTLR